MKPKGDQPRNSGGQYGETIGGTGAIRKLQHDQPLTGLAAQAEIEVESLLDAGGIPEILKRNAIRVQAVADLFYGALITAAQEGNIDKVAQYAQRYGWLSGCALRAWQALGVETKGNSAATVLDVMRSLAKEGENG